MTSPPGWHPDPWGQAEQRWWDGENWTEHTHGAAAQAAPGAQAGPSRRRRGPVIALIAGAAVFALLALALVVFIVAGASGEDTFDEPGFSIGFEYPSELERRDIPEGNADERVGLRLDSRNGIAVSKYEQENVVDENNIGLTKAVLDGVVRQISDGPAPSGRRVTIDGLPGFEYEFAVRGNPGVRSRSIFLFHGADEYQLNCEFQPARRQEVMEACNQAVETLEVTGPPGLP